MQHFGTESPLYFADRRFLEQGVRRQDEHGNPRGSPPPGHPVDTFRRENEAQRAQAASLRSALATLAPEGTDEEAPGDPAHHLACRRLFSGLMDVEKHYQRKENLLFPFLERHGITGPSTVMWGKDDEARALLKELGNALAETGGTAGEWQLVARTVAEPALAAVEEMIFKEERISSRCRFRT